MDKKKLIRILLPICIIIVIAVIWYFKNVNTNTESATSGNEGDFALEANSIDLKTLTAHGLPIIIDFGADYCAPCKEFKPILRAIHQEIGTKAIIKFVDTEKHGEIASEFPVQVIPTQVFINSDGTPYVPSNNLDIEFTMYNDRNTNEHAYTIHEGGLTADQMRLILADMGVTE